MQFRRLPALLVLLLVFIHPNPLKAQNKLRRFSDLPAPEKGWVIFHPFKASRADLISREAVETARGMEKILGGDYQGGSIDAFRHTYWMSRLCQELGERPALRLGEAHEKGNYRDFLKGRLEDGGIADAVSGEMDMKNNRAGCRLGLEYPEAEKEDLIRIILAELASGKLSMIKKNEAGKYLDSENRVIPAEYLKEWENDKVLVPSFIHSGEK